MKLRCDSNYKMTESISKVVFNEFHRQLFFIHYLHLVQRLRKVTNLETLWNCPCAPTLLMVYLGHSFLPSHFPHSLLHNLRVNPTSPLSISHNLGRDTCAGDGCVPRRACLNGPIQCLCPIVCKTKGEAWLSCHFNLISVLAFCSVLSKEEPYTD